MYMNAHVARYMYFPLILDNHTDCRILILKTHISHDCHLYTNEFGLCAGKWYHAAGHLATTIATPAAYAPLPYAVSRLGWPAGIIALAFAGATTMYTSCLLASLDRHDGVRRTRYRDLAYSIMGASWLVSLMHALVMMSRCGECGLIYPADPNSLRTHRCYMYPS